MGISKQQFALMDFLKCGVYDLALLDGIEYRLGPLIDEMVENQYTSLNELLRLVFEEARLELSESISKMLDDVLADCGSELTSVIDSIKKLDPEQDLSYYTNCLDTHLYLSNYELYRLYFEPAIERIELHTGFDVEDSGHTRQ